MHKKKQQRMAKMAMVLTGGTPVLRLLVKSSGLVEAEHQIHILHGLA